MDGVTFMTDALRTHYIARTLLLTDLSSDCTRALAPRLIIQQVPRMMIFKNRKYNNDIDADTNRDNNDSTKSNSSTFPSTDDLKSNFSHQPKSPLKPKEFNSISHSADVAPKEVFNESQLSWKNMTVIFKLFAPVLMLLAMGTTTLVSIGRYEES